MRILFVSYRIYPCDTGGTEVFNYYLAERLSEDHSVELLTYCNRKVGETELIRVRKHRPTRYITPLKLLFHVIRNRKKIDVIFLSYMKSHWFWWSILPVIRKLTGIQYVITIHGGGLTPWKPRFLYHWSFMNAFKLIGISRRICEEYEKRTGREVIYIPPLFPFRRSEKQEREIKEHFGLPLDSKIILYVGSLKGLKSPGTLLEAFNSLEPGFIERYNLYLVFAGEGALRDELTRNTMYRKRTFFPGNVSREKMPDLFKISDLYVITSQFEGTPLSLLEAVYNMVPVIGSNVEGTNYIIEDGKNGLLYQFGDQAQLAERIRKLISNEETGRRFALEAEKTYRERYSYNLVIEEYQKIFREAASK